MTSTDLESISLDLSAGFQCIVSELRCLIVGPTQLLSGSFLEHQFNSSSKTLEDGV